MAAIDKREFARFCLEQAARFGVNAHYLLAVAQHRSGIVDDTINGHVGPFGFTHEQWDEARALAAQGTEQHRLEIEALHASASDITSWRVQCQVFAAITAATVLVLTRTYRRTPEAAETYCAEFAITAVEFEDLARQIGGAVDSTAPLLAEVIFDLPASRIAKYQAGVPKGELIPVSAQTPDRNVAYLTSLPQNVKSGQYRVWYGTNRRPEDPSDPEKGYSSEPDTKVHHGYCTVFVPASHIIGSLGSAWWCRLLRGVDDRLRLMNIKPQNEIDFWNAISQQWNGLDSWHRHAVIFVHGYNVSFQRAVLQAAQIGYDLSINGAMAFFSWPSQGRTIDYPVDEDVIEQSEKPIADFMIDFATKSGADVVHIIAHSMGNRGVLRAVNRIAERAEHQTGVSFGQIALAAADVNANTFRSLCAAYSRVAKRTTLYVSAGDLAIGASVWLHKFPRVGLLPPVFVVPGIDTVNVTNVDLSHLGHGYVAEARGVLADMYQLFSSEASPERRFGLRRETTEAGENFWSIRK